MELRDEQSLQVAKLYYRGGLSQSEVAAEMGLSRPSVAKLLQHAKPADTSRSKSMIPVRTAMN